MASRHASTHSGIEGQRLVNEAYLAVSDWENEPTVSIPKWLMVLAARGEVTLRVPVDLEDDPVGDSDDTVVGD
jgi:hypothetical protein